MIKVTRVHIDLRSSALTRMVSSASVDACARCGFLVEREAKELLSVGGGSGREPSAPGQPPHLQEGELKNSVATAIDGIKVIVGPAAEHGKYQEFGTKDGKLPKRPFMRPALMNTKAKFPAQFANLRMRRIMPQ